MKLMTIGIIVGIGVAAVCVIPALKGPYNRVKNNLNEKLNAEYVVDNYKVEYVALHDRLVTVDESIQKFTVEKKVAEKKLETANTEVNVYKQRLLDAGTSNLVEFTALKDKYETAKINVSNIQLMIKTYDNALKKLDQTRSLITSNMSKAKMNIDTLSSKKVLLDTIKDVNKNIANLNGTGDSDLAINVEKLDDNLLREDIKLETLSSLEKKATIITEADAEAYLKALK